MDTLSIFILFCFGLVIGSFLNVVSLRYKPELGVLSRKNLGGRSKCPHCHKTLRWFELIPLISFLVQGGRCRSCGEKLSLQYPVVELVSGFIFAGLPIYLANFYGVRDMFAFNQPLLSFYALVALWILVFLIWLLMTIIDLRWYIIPNELNLGLGVLGIFIAAIKIFPSSWLMPFHSSFVRHYELLFSFINSKVWLNHILGAVFAALFFGIIIYLSKGRGMGMGDLKLGFVSGLVLGWPDIGLSLILAFIFGGILGVVLLLIKKKTMKDKLPFAPIFIFGMILTVFFGFQIISWYFRLFSV